MSQKLDSWLRDVGIISFQAERGHSEVAVGPSAPRGRKRSMKSSS